MASVILGVEAGGVFLAGVLYWNERHVARRQVIMEVIMGPVQNGRP